MTSRRPSTFARSWRARLEQMYSRVPDRVDDLLVRGGRVLQRMRSRKTPVAKVVYPDGFRLLVAGRSPLLSYFVCRGGDGPTRVERLPSVAKRRLHSALEHYSSQADAIIAQDPCEAGEPRLDPR